MLVLFLFLRPWTQIRVFNRKPGLQRISQNNRSALSADLLGSALICKYPRFSHQMAGAEGRVATHNGPSSPFLEFARAHDEICVKVACGRDPTLVRVAHSTPDDAIAAFAAINPMSISSVAVDVPHSNFVAVPDRPSPPAGLAREALEESLCCKRVPAIGEPIRRTARRRAEEDAPPIGLTDDGCATVVARKRADAWLRSGALSVSE